MSQNSRPSPYSTDLWEYIADMPHVPSRRDRDTLVRKVAAGEVQERRLRLWDYFFRINPDNVGLPQKKEIAELEAQLRNSEARYKRVDEIIRNEIEALNESLARVRRELSTYTARIERQVQEDVARRRSRRMTLGIVTLVIAGVVLFIAIGFDAGIWGGPRLTLCGGPVAFFIGLIGAAFLLPLLSNTDDQVSSLVQKEKAKQTPRLVEQETEWSNKLAVSTNQRQVEAGNFNKFVQQLTARSQGLRNQVNDLVRQIPKPPSDQEVERWFSEDLASLREIALNRRQLRERLIPIAGIANPINIYGPVELQQLEMIPPPFRTPGSDRNKHMQIRRFVLKPDGAFVAFHGVYNVEFVLVTKDVLFTYGTTWDFITGEQSGERADEINYTKITAISTLKSYREIQTAEGIVPLENAPSLTLNLENGKSYVVTFPDLTYLKLTDAPRFDPDNWESDQTDAVENAIKVISEQKRLAQNLVTN